MNTLLRQKLTSISGCPSENFQDEVSAFINEIGSDGNLWHASGGNWVSQLREILTQWSAPRRSWIIFLGDVLCATHQTHVDEFCEAVHAPLVNDIHAYQKLIAPLKEETDTGEYRAEFRADRLREFYRLAYLDTELATLCAATLAARIQTCNLQMASSPHCALSFIEDCREMLVPLLEMLGLWSLRRMIGDKTMQIAAPKDWTSINDACQKKQSFYAGVYANVIPLMEESFYKAGLNSQIRAHKSPVSSIQRRIDASASLNQILNLVKIDVLTNTPEECYHALGIIHQHYRPLGGRSEQGLHFRDNIAAPKFNGYRALITTVAARPNPRESEARVEFRIRTHEMEKVNTEGVAACHFQGLSPAIKAWWNNTAQREIVRDRRMNDNSPQIFVFSQLGELRQMPYGSTPVDYAYVIHSDIAEHLTHAEVNGRRVDLDTKLRNGDIVNLFSRPDFNAVSEEWLRFAHTPRAIRRARQKLAQLKPSEHPMRKITRKLLARQLAAHNLPGMTTDAEDRAFEESAQFLGYTSADAMFAAIDFPSQGASARRIPRPETIAARIAGAQLTRLLVREDNSQLNFNPHDIRYGLTPDNQGRKYVVLGQPVVGRVNRFKSGRMQLTVYAKEAMPSFPQDDIVALKWRDMSEVSRRIMIESTDRPRLLEDVLQQVYEHYPRGMYLTSSLARTSEQIARIELEVSCPDIVPIKKLESSFKAMQDERKILSCEFYDMSPFQRQISARSILQNPYSALPVREMRMFKGREKELQQLTNSLGGGERLSIICGQLRMGKTSLAHYAMRHTLPEKNFLAAYLDLQNLIEKSEDEFWRAIANAINLAAVNQRRVRARKTLFERTARARKSEVFHAFAEEFMEALPAFGGHSPVMFVDELGSLEVSWSRREAEQLVAGMVRMIETCPDLRWTLCAHHLLIGERNLHGVTRPVTKMAKPIEVKHLDKNAALRLIREPLSEVTYEPEAEAAILHVTGCHPYFLHLLLSNLVDKINSGTGRLINRADVQTATEELLESGSYFFADVTKNLSAQEHAALSTIARISLANEVVSAKDVFREWRRTGMQTSLQELGVILASLHDLGVIESVDSETPAPAQFRVQSPMLAAWVRMRAYL